MRLPIYVSTQSSLTFKKKRKRENIKLLFLKMLFTELIFKPSTFNSTFRKQNQKICTFNYLQNLLKSLWKHEKNRQVIFKTPNISLREDLMNELWKFAHSIIYKSLKSFKKLSRKLIFHLQNSKNLSNGGFNELVQHENYFIYITKRYRRGFNVSLYITILILTYPIWT